MTALLDVNALIALIDSDHIGNPAMQKWFIKHHASGWATCPLTENGAVRVLSQPAYQSGRHTPTEVIQVLNALKASFKKSYQFWPDSISISDEFVFQGILIAGTRQVTDIYLLGLVAKHRGTMVTFDRSLTWQAVIGGSDRLVTHPSAA